MTIQQMAYNLRAFGYTVKINSVSLVVSRNSEDVTKQDIYDLFDYKDLSKVSTITLIRHQDEDSFDRVLISF